MKKLLSMLAVSTLVGTSASNLKPVFTSDVVNHGFKSNQLNKDLTMTNNPFIGEFKDLNYKKIEKVMVARNGTVYVGSITNGLYKSKTNGNFEQVNGIPDNCAIQSINISLSGEIWVGTNQDLYFSNDNGISFNPVTNDKINNITSVAIAPNGTVWVGTEKEGQHGSGLLYKSTDGINFKSLFGIVETIKCVYLHYCKNGYEVLFLIPDESMKKFVDEQIKIYNWKIATFKTQIFNV